ncbi:MAG TPA: nitrilase-related carbon-nitrogen hydrolase [Phycisphaerae bacterium]|nr:nitrilase-related carbon-nitrogen hydrolase [Phycisphaerae bacterium]
MEKITVAALSPTIVSGDKEKNLASAYQGLLAAKHRGVELAVFSEWYLTHCIDERSYRVAEPVPDGPAARQVIEFARELEMTVAMGIEELDPDRGVIYSTHFLAGPAGYIGKHRKTHLMAGEWKTHRAGDRLDVFDAGKCKVGIEICHENMYPENSRVQTLKGMEVLAAPFGCGGSGSEIRKADWIHDFHMACWRARCFDNGIFMIVSGGNGQEGKKYKTYACIIDPWAEVIAAIDPTPTDPEINLVVAELDPERFASRRTDADYPLKKRRPELYGPLCELY